MLFTSASGMEQNINKSALDGLDGGTFTMVTFLDAKKKKKSVTMEKGVVPVVFTC